MNAQLAARLLWRPSARAAGLRCGSSMQHSMRSGISTACTAPGCSWSRSSAWHPARHPGQHAFRTTQRPNNKRAHVGLQQWVLQLPALHPASHTPPRPSLHSYTSSQRLALYNGSPAAPVPAPCADGRPDCNPTRIMAPANPHLQIILLHSLCPQRQAGVVHLQQQWSRSMLDVRRPLRCRGPSGCKARADYVRLATPG